MTLKDFFDLLAANPSYILAYFLLVPLAAFIGTIIGKGEEGEAMWQYFYSFLIYLVAIPGIFAVTLSVYLFFFERKSVFDTNILTQILPVLSMVATLLIIRRNIDLDYIPGFGKISGLMSVIAVSFVAMWIMEKTHILVFSYVPIQYALLALAGLFIVFRLGWSKMSA